MAGEREPKAALIFLGLLLAVSWVGFVQWAASRSQASKFQPPLRGRVIRVMNPANAGPGASGGGIHSRAESTWTLARSIVSGNTSTRAAADIGNQGPLSYVGANLVQSVVHSGPGSVTGPAPSNAAPLLLSVLGNYGGPAQTMPPLAGSPAVDAAVGSTITTDQRGAPIIGTADLGASEAALPPAEKSL